MAPRSSKEAFGALIATLVEKELGWVVDQVRQQIELGKPITRRAKELRYASSTVEENSKFSPEQQLRPGREVQFRATVDYTDDERLLLLLSAIQQAILNTAAIEAATTKQFPRLTFVSEDGDTKLAVQEQEPADRSGALLRLQTAIQEMVAAIGDSHAR